MNSSRYNNLLPTLQPECSNPQQDNIQPANVIMIPWSNPLILIIFCLPPVALLLFYCYTLLRKHFLHPLEEIKDAVNRLVQGNLQLPPAPATQKTRLTDLKETWQGLALLAQTISIREASLKKENQELKLAFELTPIQIWFLIDPETQGLLNQARANFLGKHAQELAFRSYRDIYDFDPPSAEKGIKDNQQVFRQKKTSITQDWFKNRAGELRCLLVTKTPKLSADNEVEMVICTAQDITERVRSNEQVRRLSTVVEQSPVAIAITDQDFIIEYINPAFRRLILRPKQEIIGQTARQILDSRQVDSKLLTRIVKHIAHGHPWQGEFEFVPRQGEHRWLRASCFPLHNDHGLITSYVAILSDITEEKQFSDELLEAKLEAEQANQLKSEFLANISHEIRTPINAIWGMSSLLWDSELSQEQRGYLEAIRSSCQTLLQVINQILDFSKYEADKQILEKHELDLLELQESMTNIFYPQAKIKNIDFVTFFDPNLPQRILSDSLKIKQVLINLLGNALKFTRQGGILLKFTACTDDSDQKHIKIEVQDTGLGIPRQKQKEVFKPFVQADGSTTRQFGGTGLGLSIVKKCAHLLQGEIGLESEPGMGSCFWIRLPLETSQTARSIQEEHPGLKQLASYKALLCTPKSWWGYQTSSQLDSLGIQTMLCLDKGQITEWITNHNSKQRGNFPPFSELNTDRLLIFLTLDEGQKPDQKLLTFLHQKGIIHICLIASPQKDSNPDNPPATTQPHWHMQPKLILPLTMKQLLSFLMTTVLKGPTQPTQQTEQDSTPVLDLTDILLTIDQDWNLLKEMASLFLKDFTRYINRLEELATQNNRTEIVRLQQTMLGAAANIGGCRLRALLEEPIQDLDRQAEIIGRIKEEFALLQRELTNKLDGLQKK